jgi:hypothetical protein
MLGPLQVNPSTKEPFLRLRKHPNVIITPPRLIDVPYVVSPLNDERVHVWLQGPPYPYTEGDVTPSIGMIQTPRLILCQNTPGNSYILSNQNVIKV